MGSSFYGPVHQVHHGHPVFWVLIFVLFVALIVFAFSSLVRLTRTGSAAASRGDAALESVRMRYARGEIDRDEFIRVSADLGGSPPVTA